MKYSYEYKKHCVELYRQGKWAETPEGVSTDRFHHAVVEWNRLEKTCGPEILQHTERPLQKWTTDVSQFDLSWGKCYISPALDMNTNEIISYNLSLSPNMEQIKDMLQKVFHRFPSLQGLIMHSDQGWQCQHAFYRKELQKHGIVQSMSRKGNCYDNCIMENFFGRSMNEMFYGFEKNYPSFETFSKAIADHIDYYNNSRIQAKTKWMPPSKFREASLVIS